MTATEHRQRQLRLAFERAAAGYRLSLEMWRLERPGVLRMPLATARHAEELRRIGEELQSCAAARSAA